MLSGQIASLLYNGYGTVAPLLYYKRKKAFLNLGNAINSIGKKNYNKADGIISMKKSPFEYKVETLKRELQPLQKRCHRNQKDRLGGKM
ncbi:hypothetical protein POVCU1_060010 [Plasmodium ovale curtisi]|uniref:Uncharacterized protein n=1 Tax=Plasmodium ovale curtisi TaxID=864141 RepID=A0A1A8X751_PLAOA|nr:hypothetical protein POVCU1_060010 [Plasmodium ovale curtisi]